MNWHKVLNKFINIVLSDAHLLTECLPHVSKLALARRGCLSDDSVPMADLVFVLLFFLRCRVFFDLVPDLRMDLVFNSFEIFHWDQGKKGILATEGLLLSCTGLRVDALRVEGIRPSKLARYKLLVTSTCGSCLSTRNATLEVFAFGFMSSSLIRN